jgi:hypothetical protein
VPSRVFVSCGQATTEEREVAAAVHKWFAERGFQPYVAIQAQSLADVNSGIISELKRADFYVFIDFRREELPSGLNGKNPAAFRGSLFTNQELAIAHFLQFERAIFLQQGGVQLEGLLRYMASNAEIFESPSQVPGLVEKLVTERFWDPTYSRHLVVGAEHWTPVLRYGDHTGTKRVRVYELDIHNRRNDVAALNAVARLKQITLPDGTTRSDIDSSPLKAVGQPGYAHVIWPERHAAWDLLAVHADAPATVSLNSSLDVPRLPLVSVPGLYRVTFEIFAVNFPSLTFTVILSVSNEPTATSAQVEKLS